MNDESNEQPTTADTHDEGDPFEVKWRKKSTGSSGTAAVPPVVEDTASLRKQLDEAQEQIRNLQDRWQRAAADLSNLRRRTEQDREEMEKFASMVLVAELLPVLDNFDRALSTIPGNLQMLTWIQGIMLIERHLQALLQQRGVQPIEAEKQQFNPSLHEAIAEQETNDVSAGEITRVYQTGYTMHGRIIRPALVEVARASGSTATGAAENVPDGETIVDEAEIENVGP